MALQSFTVSIGALRDANNNDKNYVSGESIYVKTIGGSFAPIFRDLAGTSEIAQDGLANKTNEKGQFTFFVEAGDYILEYQSQSTPVTVVGADYFNSKIEESVNQIIIDTSASRGFRVVGDFASGFTYELFNDVGIDSNGDSWIYVGLGAPNKIVAAGTNPVGNADYEQVTYGTASSVATDSGQTVQKELDDYERLLRANLIAQGYSGDYGFFANGFDYVNSGDVGIDVDGEIYTYAGSDPLPVTVVSGTDPAGDSDYLKLKINILRLDADDVARSDKNIVVGSNAQPNSSSKRDAYQILRTITDLTDCHAMADRTVISSFTDSGTYGSFDVVTEYAHTAGIADHLYAFQGRGKKTGGGNLSNYASFYHAPNLNGGEVENLHSVRVLNNTGDSTVINQHGLHIQPLSSAINNFAIYSWGETPSVHVGRVTIGSIAIDEKSALSVQDITSMTGLHKVGINSNCAANDIATSSYSAYSGTTNISAAINVSVLNGYTTTEPQLVNGATANTVNGYNCPDLTKGEANRGYSASLVAGTAKWNVYAGGTAQNYFRGNIGVGSGKSEPRAAIEIAPSDGSAWSAPLRFNAGVNLATPVNGTFEFDGTNLYFTIGGVRRTVTLT